MGKIMKVLFKTKITIDVISDEPLEGGAQLDLSNLDYAITDGSWSGLKEVGKSKPIKGKRAIKEIQSHGSDPEFFFLDKNGYELED